MNTSFNDHDANLRYAEYVLGVLDADARAAIEQEIQSSAEVANLVALWAQRLSPLSENVQTIQPADYVWERVRATLQLQHVTPQRAPLPRPSLWENLRFWQWFGLGASALAAACLVLLLIPGRHVTQQGPVSASYMASAVVQNDGHTGWTATMDVQHARMVIVPVSPQTMANGRAPELWLIPAGQKPIAVGMIDTRAATTIALNDALIARLGSTAALAVSVEPLGGSPTGQPTGPVIAKGAIGAAPESLQSDKSAALRYMTAADGSAA